jgi:hypothetical protein
MATTGAMRAAVRAGQSVVATPSTQTISAEAIASPGSSVG